MAPAGLKLRKLHCGRAAAQPGHRHAHVVFDERRDAREIALDGTTAVVEDAAGNPDGRERLRAGVKRAGPRGTPQVPEGGEAEARPQRQQRGLNRPAAVIAVEKRHSAGGSNTSCLLQRSLVHIYIVANPLFPKDLIP